MITKLSIFSEAWISISSFSLSSNLVAPSKDTHAEFLLSTVFLSVIRVETGSIRGLKLNEWGAKGVRHTHYVFAYTIEPPAERLYAVEPVGVAIINPSPTKVVMKLPSKWISIYMA